MSAVAKKTYPDTTLTDRLRERGIAWSRLWEVPGPRNTSIAWMSCYTVGAGGGIVIVQTFDDGGWDAFSAAPTIEVAATIDDVVARCCPAKAEG